MLFKNFLSVKVDHDAEARTDVLLRALDRLMGGVSAPEPVARVREAFVPVSLQHLPHRLLARIGHQRGVYMGRHAWYKESHTLTEPGGAAPCNQSVFRRSCVLKALGGGVWWAGSTGAG